MKKYIKFLPIVIVVIAILAFLVYNNKQNKNFYREKVNSTVVARNNWQLRATEFYLKNGLRVDSTYIMPLDLKIGDSISKEAESNIFKIYRKDKLNRYRLNKVYKNK